nr:MAG TPA: hypothetical protein [Caudoviricetes sp.]
MPIRSHTKYELSHFYSYFFITYYSNLPHILNLTRLFLYKYATIGGL